MPNTKLEHIAYVSRLLLGFLFIYHGLVPKILWLSPQETHLVQLSGLSLSAEIVSPISGIVEIALGASILLFPESKVPIYLAAIALLCLLFYVCVVSPFYLVQAFNPVTTNILGLGLCYLALFSSNTRKT
ncbi:DoxX-like family protein [Aliikangiella sp. IMCC44653]